jgi:hypothetical protein
MGNAPVRGILAAMPSSQEGSVSCTEKADKPLALMQFAQGIDKRVAPTLQIH